MKGKFKTTLTNGTHRFDISTTMAILVSLDGMPVRAFPPGNYKFNLRSSGGSIEVDPSDPKVPYKFDIHSFLFPPGEHVDDLPPPQPSAPDNWLQAVRQKVRTQMGIIREEFSDRPSLYELGDQEPLFEEEELKIRTKAKKDAERRKKAEEEAKRREDQDRRDDQANAPQPPENKEEKSPSHSS